MKTIPELWMLSVIDDDGKPTDDFVLACDNSGVDDMLCYFSFSQAQRGASHQLDMYGIECTPVRVFANDDRGLRSAKTTPPDEGGAS